MRLGAFLGFVVLLQFGYPVTLHGPVWTGLYLVAYVGVVLSGVVLVRGAHDRIAPAAATGAALLCCAAWVGATGDGGAALVSMFAAGAAFQLALMYSLLRFVYRRSRTPELEIVLAAVCVYLLLGGLFTTVFGALESLRPGSFADSAHPGGAGSPGSSSSTSPTPRWPPRATATSCRSRRGRARCPRPRASWARCS